MRTILKVLPFLFLAVPAHATKLADADGLQCAEVHREASIEHVEKDGAKVLTFKGSEKDKLLKTLNESGTPTDWEADVIDVIIADDQAFLVGSDDKLTCLLWGPAPKGAWEALADAVFGQGS